MGARDTKIKEMEKYKYRVEDSYGNVVLKADPYAFYSELRPDTASIIMMYQNSNGQIRDG